MPARHSLPFEKGPKETEGLHFRDFLLFGKHFQHSVSKLSADLWGGNLIQMRKENVKPEHTPSSNHNKINTISFSLLIFFVKMARKDLPLALLTKHTHRFTEHSLRSAP